MREIIVVMRYVLCDDNTETLENIMDDAERPYLQGSGCGCKKDIIYLREVKK